MRTILTAIAAFGLIIGFTHAEEAKAQTKTVTYSVDGMTCGGCENKLSKILSAIDGAKVEKVCSKSGCAKVTYDPGKASKKDITAAVKSSGFKLQGEQVTLNVNGMTCGGCSGKVNKALAALDGVSGAEACHKSNKAVVTFDPAKTSEKQIASAIKKSGFKIVQ